MAAPPPRDALRLVAARVEQRLEVRRAVEHLRPPHAEAAARRERTHGPRERRLLEGTAP